MVTNGGLSSALSAIHFEPLNVSGFFVGWRIGEDG